MKQMSAKFVDKNKCVYVAYMDLEKVYDRVDRVGNVVCVGYIWNKWSVESAKSMCKE